MESPFDQITAAIGADEGPIKQLIEKLTKELTIYHVDIREIEKGSSQPTKQDYVDSQEVATVADDRIGNHLFDTIVTQQIYSAPCTVIVSALATYLHG